MKKIQWKISSTGRADDPIGKLAVSPEGQKGQKLEMAEESKMVLLISLMAAAAVMVIKKCKVAQTKDAWEEAPSRSVQTHQGHVSSVMQPRFEFC